MTRDEILKLASRRGFHHLDSRGRQSFDFDDHGIIAFANAIRNAALEEAAGICDDYVDAAAIREAKV